MFFKKTTKNGDIYNYYNETDTQEYINNDKKKYSMINHIEYDEESYNAIMVTFNSINDSYKGTISSACSNINSAVSSFPDKYSVSGLDGVEENIESKIGLIKSLSEIINYSILGYQTCDEELIDGLYSLIDSLFGEGEANLADNFKESIKNNIEDREGILEYKADTNFRKMRYKFVCNLLIGNSNASIVEGEEFKNYVDQNNLNDMDSLVILKEIATLNGIDMTIYKVIDANGLNKEGYIDGYNKYVEDSKREIANVDKNVLKYLNDTGVIVSFFSDYSVDKSVYTKSGELNARYAGYANSSNLNTVVVYNPNYQYDTDCVLHELGHNFDHSIYRNMINMEQINSITSEEVDCSFLPDKTSARELAHREYAGFQPNYVYEANYNNSDQYSPSEFFAESFRKYYTSKEEERKKFANLIPETFEFFEKMEDWTGDQIVN